MTDQGGSETFFLGGFITVGIDSPQSGIPVYTAYFQGVNGLENKGHREFFKQEKQLLSARISIY